MGEDEVERRTAPVPQHGAEQLAERPGGDEPGDGLVLEQRLLGDVEPELLEQQAERRG